MGEIISSSGTISGVLSGVKVIALTRKRSGDYSQNPIEMAKFMRILGIDGFYLTYQDLMQKDLSDDHWHNLIFVRPMTAVELKWYEREKIDFPAISPPLWLNDTT